MTARRRFTLTLEDAGTPDDGDVIPRLRAALKHFLRSYALRCTSIIEDQPMPADSLPSARPCRSCGASIIFVETLAGKAIPLDADPAEDGNVIIEGGKARVLSGLYDAQADQVRYKSHFATCTHPERHRRR